MSNKNNKNLTKNNTNSEEIDVFKEKMKNNFFIWNVKMIKILIKEQNIELLNKRDFLGNTAFIAICISSYKLATVLLKTKGIKYNTKNRYEDDWESGFIIACQRQPELAIKMLERNDIDFNTRNKKGQTGWDIAKEYNFESFKFYQSYLEQEKLTNNNQQKDRISKLIL